MPIIRIELFPGRGHELKMEIAEAITRLLEEKAGIRPEATTILFQEVQPSDWIVAGKPYGESEGDTGQASNRNTEKE